ncbi:hypothetical protein [Pseudomonas amygdali]|uniref:hypothetical protein n=1 Tax=Pseudomonas amygdali TaxID=47877 RepID=UPI0006E5E0E1|nr:hypothetical protein [Pseudomonas amygdali]KPY55617.1 hypothetical protein ALO93_200116 [Pseudomonas amygdali pv. sesami]
MSTNFDPSKLNQTASSKGSGSVKSERLFLVVEAYETPPNGFHYAVGHRADAPDEKVRVRLTTVSERIADRPRENPDKIRSQYVTGENTRELISDKQKAGITLISFDDARRVGTVEGVTEYRAHWSKTMSTSPQAEVMGGMAHIRLREGQESGGQRKPAQAYVELLKSSVLTGQGNIEQALLGALAIKDDQDRARDPLAIMRVMYEGKVFATPRIYPTTETVSIFDQTLGESKNIQVPLDGEKTVAALLDGAPGRNEFETRQLDTVRALYAGVKGLEEPKINSVDETVRDSIRNLYYGSKAGQLHVELISAEKIDFGSDSRKTYLTDRDRPQLAAYVMKEKVDDTRVKETPGYTSTVLSVLRHPDGEPYAVFASPTVMYPKPEKLADLAAGATNEVAMSSEVVKPLAINPDQRTRSPARAPEPELGDDSGPVF